MPFSNFEMSIKASPFFTSISFCSWTKRPFTSITFKFTFSELISEILNFPLPGFGKINTLCVLGYPLVDPISLKFACKVMSESTVMLPLGFVEMMLPFCFQFSNVNPVFGLAVSKAVALHEYWPAPVTVPPLAGDFCKLTVYFLTWKLAVKVRLVLNRIEMVGVRRKNYLCTISSV